MHLTSAAMRRSAGVALLAWLFGLVPALYAGPFDTRPEDMVEKRFDQLADQNVSEWGRLALKINARDWQHGETKHFALHFFKRGQKVAVRSEAFYSRIAQFFGNRPDLLGDGRSHVYAFHESRDWEQFTAAIKVPGIAGVTRGNEFFYLTTAEGGRFDSEGKVQAHEMTHLVFNRFFRGTPPLWLNEGVAEYFGQRETSSVTEFRRLMGQTAPYDLDRLFAAKGYPEGQNERQAFYAEAAIIVDFLTRTDDRRALLPRFVDQLIRDSNVDQALPIYGYKDPEEFRKAYDKYRRHF